MSTSNNETGRLSPQSTLQQRYMIVGQAGRGGMGAVYMATDMRVAQRRVAIKEMSQAHLSAEELAEAAGRFQQEAMMLGSLSHPNLPRIYDAFSERGRFYLVMDFIDGKTLHQLLKEAKGQPLGIAQTLLYARQLCDVLAYLHQHNPPIIFRDVKPANVMVTENGHVFLIDFGIARFFKEGQQQDTILLGSPGYAPPEQHGIAQTNPRSDLYGLGATLHYCLTGHDPYYASDRFSFAPIRKYNPQVPVELDQLIQRMVAQDERARPANALEVQQALIAITRQAAEHTNSLSPATAATQYVQPSPVSGSHVAAQAPTVAIPPQATPNPPSIPSLPLAAGQQIPPTYGLQQGNVADPAPLWTGAFTALFGLVLALTAGVSIYALNFLCPSDHVLETGLSLLLVLVALAATAVVKGRTPRSVMLASGLVVLLASFAFAMQARPDLAVIGPTTPSSPACVVTTLVTLPLYNVLLTVGLAASGLISLYWLTRQGNTTRRVTLLVVFGIAIICGLLQPLFGEADYSKHILLLVALIALIQGVLLAAQMERSHSRAVQSSLQQA